MKAACLLTLASLVLCNLALCGGQGVPAEDELDHRTIDDIILQRAESLLLRSILKKMQDEDERNEGISPQSERVTKRQHPGKRYSDDLEKRQHPGRREDDDDEPFLDLQRRQHPGKREEEMHSFTEIQKRQHPGRRAAPGLVPEPPAVLLGELSKRQHPGKRLYGAEERGDDWDAEADEDLPEVKRQHPGKRLWDNSSPDLDADSPCDVLEPTSCSKSSLLLDFLDNINKSPAEEKRQHPGRRSAPEEASVEEE
ncbi:pro-thyrotropin-releasing hormone [Betta splendens]|uniref:Pro-thyrotropin-releasing hormone n=1 Tax=Betta splendens TaxID=158456 RepID=A0A6P7N0D6_BETSP|nr:pro-thyrotropin-releasing hormone [Betta splendens]